MLVAIVYEQNPGPVLKLLDQRRLPKESTYITCETLEDVAAAIEDMVVRGAPAIGCAAAYGFALDASSWAKDRRWCDYQARFREVAERLASTRPTAVNLFYAIDAFKAKAQEFTEDLSMDQAATQFSGLADKIFSDDLTTCQAIGTHGAEVIKGDQLKILTHCNTGSLATAGYGTALGVIRSLAPRISRVFVDETRPFLQGARLTAFELCYEQIPHSVHVDGAACYLMETEKIDAVITGADRIARNGDTANKIGTYGLAVAAKYHGIPFYVAAPMSTFDASVESGASIPVESRPGWEVSHMAGQPVTPEDSEICNPSFDITPGPLVTGFITEQGVLQPPFFSEAQP